MRRGEGPSLLVQRLRLCASTAGCMGAIPGWGTKILQARQPKKKNKTKNQGGEFRALLFPAQREEALSTASRLQENNCLLFQPPSLWYFVTAAQAAQ